MFRRVFSTAVCTGLLAATSFAFNANAQMNMPMAPAGKAPLSPPEMATTTLDGQTLTVKYSAPSLRGRHLGGPEIVPFGTEWRLGANEATTLVTPVSLHIGTLLVPAGTYTLFALPTAKDWTLIVSSKTGEWGIPYPAGSDLGRTPMKKKELAGIKEMMSLSFEKTSAKDAELHMKWEKTDAYVKITTP